MQHEPRQPRPVAPVDYHRAQASRVGSASGREADFEAWDVLENPSAEGERLTAPRSGMSVQLRLARQANRRSRTAQLERLGVALNSSRPRLVARTQAILDRRPRSEPAVAAAPGGAVTQLYRDEQDAIDQFMGLFESEEDYREDFGEHLEEALRFLRVAEQNQWDDFEDVVLKYVRRVEDERDFGIETGRFDDDLGEVLPRHVRRVGDERDFGIETGRFDEVDPEVQRSLFNIAVGRHMKNFATGGVRFGAAADFFDPTLWRKDPKNDEALVLKPGKQPSVAVKALFRFQGIKPGFEGTETAKLDCVESIEVARWLAEMEVAGEEAFNRKFGGRRFCLAAPGSTGIESRSLAVRKGGRSDAEYSMGGTPTDGIFGFHSGPNEGKSARLSKFLNKLPIGTRVMWRNFDPGVPLDHDFKNENTVKTGADEFAAHPLGVFSLADLPRAIAEGGYADMRELLQETSDSDEEEVGTSTTSGRGIYADINSIQDYIKKFIRIVEIETFESPF